MRARQNRKRVLVVAGARPNFVKIAPLLAAFRRHRDLEFLLVHTGQHYDATLSQIFFCDLEIPKPDIDLEIGSSSHAAQTAEIMKCFEPVVLDYRPCVVVVVGDVNSTIACALTAVKLGVQVAHVEAGLRSFDRSMPEEVNRLLTDAISDFLFATEPSAVRNLRREGIPRSKIHLVGNIMVDSLLASLHKARRSTVLQRLELVCNSKRAQIVDYAVLTLHRPSNVDRPETLEGILEAVSRVAERVPVIFPVHPRTQKELERLTGASVFKSRAGPCGLRTTPPLGYLDFLRLMSKARLVLTDSGGIQEETTVLRVPCLTLRENTERPITLTQGTNRLVGTDPRKLWKESQTILNSCTPFGRIPHLWDGKTALRIVQILRQALR